MPEDWAMNQSSMEFQFYFVESSLLFDKLEIRQIGRFNKDFRDSGFISQL